MNVKRLKAEKCKGGVAGVNIDTFGFFSEEDIDFLVQPIEDGTQILCRNLRVLALVQVAITKWHKLPVKRCGLLASMLAIETPATPEQLAEFLPVH